MLNGKTLLLSAAAALAAAPLSALDQKVRTPFLPGWGQVPLEQVEAQAARYPGVVHLHGKADKKVVALTYDDGPSLDTPALLDVLKRHKVKAAFFWQGQNVGRSPMTVKRALEEGHALGSHSWSHPYLDKEPRDSYWRTQIENTQTMFEKRIGKKPRFFRPPYGFLSDAQVQDFADRGFEVVGGSVVSDDWFFTHELPEAEAVDKIVERVLDYVHPGAIVVMHDSGGRTRVPTVKATDRLIGELKRRGYRIVPVGELIGAEPYF